jgi:hypothetical protein
MNTPALSYHSPATRRTAVCLSSAIALINATKIAEIVISLYSSNNWSSFAAIYFAGRVPQKVMRSTNPEIVANDENKNCDVFDVANGVYVSSGGENAFDAFSLIFSFLTFLPKMLYSFEAKNR